eukprot:141229-Chlamydomonas_euryale.AAC.1
MPRPSAKRPPRQFRRRPAAARACRAARPHRTPSCCCAPQSRSPCRAGTRPRCRPPRACTCALLPSCAQEAMGRRDVLQPARWQGACACAWRQSCGKATHKTAASGTAAAALYTGGHSTRPPVYATDGAYMLPRQWYMLPRQ